MVDSVCMCGAVYRLRSVVVLTDFVVIDAK